MALRFLVASVARVSQLLELDLVAVVAGPAQRVLVLWVEAAH